MTLCLTAPMIRVSAILLALALDQWQEDLEIELEWRKAPFRWHISPASAKRVLLPGASADIACQVLYVGEGGNPHLTPEAVIRATGRTVGMLIVRRELAATRAH